MIKRGWAVFDIPEADDFATDLSPLVDNPALAEEWLRANADEWTGARLTICRALELDGCLHIVPSLGRCICDRGNRQEHVCCECAGYVHRQAIYGGFMGVCEDCGKQEGLKR